VHARRNGCANVPETAIHLLAKEKIAAGVRRGGWTVKVEEEGNTPNGESWVADVVAMREGERTLAFEVQWSWQSQDKTRLRQSRYESAKIVGFWFFRQHEFQSDPSVPAFRLDFNKISNEFEVLIPSHENDPSKNRRKSKFSQFWRQSVELSAFVEGALNGRLQFAPALNRKFEMEVSAAPTACNACGRRIRILAGLKFAIQKELPGFSDISVPIYNLPGSPKTAELLSSIVPYTALKRYGIGKVVHGQQYLGLLNSCVHCNRPIGNSEALRLVNIAEPILHCSAFLNLDWASRVDSSDIFRWWFDDRPASEIL
jgi:competence protein CoiA